VCYHIDACTGIVTTIASGPATAAGLARPHGCGLDAAGNLYIADTHNPPRARGGVIECVRWAAQALPGHV
jgi:hypothetical protein